MEKYKKLMKYLYKAFINFEKVYEYLQKVNFWGIIKEMCGTLVSTRTDMSLAHARVTTTSHERP